MNLHTVAAGKTLFITNFHIANITTVAKKVSVSLLAVAVLLPAAIARPQAVGQPYGIESRDDVNNVAPIRQQILKEEEWLRWRKEHIVPEVMQRVGVDTWLIGEDDGAFYMAFVLADLAEREGGMGVVYLAKHQMLDSEFAVKLIEIVGSVELAISQVM